MAGKDCLSLKLVSSNKNLKVEFQRISLAKTMGKPKFLRGRGTNNEYQHAQTDS